MFAKIFFCLKPKVDESEPPPVEVKTIVVRPEFKTGADAPPAALPLAGKKSQKAWVEDYAADQSAAKANKEVRFSTAAEEDTASVPLTSSRSSTEQTRATAMDRLVNRSRVDAEGTFLRYDKDADGYVSREDLFDGLKELELGLTPEMYRQYIDCNFMYADMDGDGMLNFEEYLIIHGMINEVRRKFQRFDKDQDGLINKTDFTRIVKELHLNLDEDMCRSYVDMNFRFVDRSFRGTISFGQFLACYANFLISHSLMHSKAGLDSRPNTAPPPPPTPPSNVGSKLLNDDTLIVEDIIDDDEFEDPSMNASGGFPGSKKNGPL